MHRFEQSSATKSSFLSVFEALPGLEKCPSHRAFRVSVQQAAYTPNRPRTSPFLPGSCWPRLLLSPFLKNESSFDLSFFSRKSFHRQVELFIIRVYTWISPKGWGLLFIWIKCNSFNWENMAIQQEACVRERLYGHRSEKAGLQGGIWGVISQEELPGRRIYKFEEVSRGGNGKMIWLSGNP